MLLKFLDQICILWCYTSETPAFYKFFVQKYPSNPTVFVEFEHGTAGSHVLCIVYECQALIQFVVQSFVIFVHMVIILEKPLGVKLGKYIII